MSEKDINRWQDTVTPREKAPQPWKIGDGGSWDRLEVQPIPDEMLAELAQRYQYAGTPWNCRSMPLSAGDREYMYLLYYSMQGLVARMRQAEKRAAEAEAERDALKADHARLLEKHNNLHDNAAKDRAERDALRADAERYRWLREQHEGHEELAFDADGLPMPLEPTALAFTVFHPKDGGLEPVGCIPGELDTAIDAAMKGTQ